MPLKSLYLLKISLDDATDSGIGYICIKLEFVSTNDFLKSTLRKNKTNYQPSEYTEHTSGIRVYQNHKK